MKFNLMSPKLFFLIILLTIIFVLDGENTNAYYYGECFCDCDCEGIGDCCSGCQEADKCSGGQVCDANDMCVCPTPSAPTNPSASCSGTTITTSWGAVAGASSYAIRIDDQSNSWVCGGPLDTCIDVGSTSYSRSGIAGNSYGWWVHARNACGGVSAAAGSGGFSCPASCSNECPSSGATQCSGSNIQTCGNFDADSCLEWGSPAACGAGQTCSGSSCVSACGITITLGHNDYCAFCGPCSLNEGDCDPGQCAGGLTCGVDNGIAVGLPSPPAWAATDACIASCSNECPSSGSTQCSGSNIQTCGNFDADSCLEWGSPASCPAGQTCSGSSCVSSCSNECPSSGARQCSGNSVQTCGNYDADSCLEWGGTSACSAGTPYCTGAGFCVECTDSAQCTNYCEISTNTCSSVGTDCCFLFCDDYDYECFEEPFDGACEWNEFCSNSCTCQIQVPPPTTSLTQTLSSSLTISGCGFSSSLSTEKFLNTNECTVAVLLIRVGLDDESDGIYVETDNDFGSRVWTGWQGCTCNCASSSGLGCSQVHNVGTLVTNFRTDGTATPVYLHHWNDCTSGPGKINADFRITYGDTATHTWNGGVYQATGDPDAACTPSCTNDPGCTLVGLTQCSGSNVQTCGNFDEDSCLEWGSPASCPAGQTCSGSSCVISCSNDPGCTSVGLKQCSGDSAQTCGNFDPDPCLEWGADLACGGGTPFCSAGSCVQCTSSSQCTAVPSPTCVDSNTLRTFSASCSGDSCSYPFSDTACGGGNICSGGSCISACGITINQGHNDYCLYCGPCGRGEGDCDPGQCQSFLDCVDNVGAFYGMPAGHDVCLAAIGHDFYCVDKQTIGSLCGFQEGDCDPGQCGAQLDCGVDNGLAAGLPSPPASGATDACVCANGYVWNPGTGVCQTIETDCSATPEASCYVSKNANTCYNSGTGAACCSGIIRGYDYDYTNNPIIY